jgi:hypothetical protein
VLISATGCFAPPQIGADERTFRTVDALYTAVSMHDKEQVSRCATKLEELRRDERLPKGAYETLKSVIDDVRKDRWDPARTRLRDFMLGQHP